MAEIDLTKKSGPSDHRFNYRGQHRYVVTMRTARREHVFVDREIVLRLLNILREACWKHHFVVYAYCCLPDELILVIRGKSDRSDLKIFLRTLRETSRQQIIAPGGAELWRRTYTERVLRKTEDTRDVVRGVFAVPVTRGLAGGPQDYPFSGSFDREQIIGKERRDRPARPRR
jgi:REP element-mobilizing transposase RayT